MPAIRVIDLRKPSPLRRMPRNVNMTILEPPPHVCVKHRKIAKTYADGCIWCELCGHALAEGQYVDRRRGRAVQQIAPGWKPVKTD
jgi:hypothetical protein